MPKPPVLLYLDQNYSSRIAKFLLGQRGQEPFGALYEVLERKEDVLLIPPSPFHVLELRGGYLLPVFQTFFARFSRGTWVRPWLEVLSRQVQRGALAREDLLSAQGSWDEAADLGPLEDILELAPKGAFLERSLAAQVELRARLELGAHSPPFVTFLGRLLAFRSLEAERYTRPSDLNDLIMAATVGPYVDVLATDRYLREALARIGYPGRVYSGRRHEVLGLIADLEGLSRSASTARPL